MLLTRVSPTLYRAKRFVVDLAAGFWWEKGTGERAVGDFPPVISAGGSVILQSLVCLSNQCLFSTVEWRSLGPVLTGLRKCSFIYVEFHKNSHLTLHILDVQCS